jgi:preprotein translocase subunit SecG
VNLLVNAVKFSPERGKVVLETLSDGDFLRVHVTDQGEGIAGMFGGAGTTPLGSRSGNVLTRFTSILGALFLFGAFALGWVNRTPESSNLEARARVERLRQSESTDWWVENVQPSVPQEAESETAAPAGEAPTSLQR